MAETTETVGFVNTINQFGDLHESVSRISRNSTDTTIKVDLSYTPPNTPPLGAKEGGKGQKVSNTPESNHEEQEQSNSQTVSQTKPLLKTTPFNTVVERPLFVEQKINKRKVVQKQVQITDVQESLEVADTVEVIPPQPKQKVRKTRKGTKPNQDFGLAPWNSVEQLGRFYRALVNKLPHCC